MFWMVCWNFHVWVHSHAPCWITNLPSYHKWKGIWSAGCGQSSADCVAYFRCVVQSTLAEAYILWLHANITAASALVCLMCLCHLLFVDAKSCGIRKLNVERLLTAEKVEFYLNTLRFIFGTCLITLRSGQVTLTVIGYCWLGLITSSNEDGRR